MHLFRRQNAAIAVLGGFAFLGMTGVGSAPEQTSRVSPDQFVRALATDQTQVTDLYLAQGTNVNARVGQDRPLLLSAILQRDTRIARRPIDAGACADL